MNIMHNLSIFIAPPRKHIIQMLKCFRRHKLVTHWILTGLELNPKLHVRRCCFLVDAFASQITYVAIISLHLLVTHRSSHNHFWFVRHCAVYFLLISFRYRAIC